jgi:hypothetical protein
MGSEFRTDFLVAQSKLLTGVGSCLNVFGNYYTYNTSETAEKADRNALAMDWRMVGLMLEALERRRVDVPPPPLLWEEVSSLSSSCRRRRVCFSFACRLPITD